MLSVISTYKDVTDDRFTIELDNDGYRFKAHLTKVHNFYLDDDEIPGVVQGLVTRTQGWLAMLPDSPRKLLGGKGPELDSFRPGQREAAALAVAAISPGSVKRAYIDAPTGSGKSVIALACADLVCHWRDDATAVIATMDHQLQEQYAEVKGVGSITGRANWPCLIEPCTADKAPCTTGKLLAQACKAYDHCPYFLQKHQGLQKPAPVSNYAYLLRLRNSTPISVFIGDEGHDAEKVIREYTAVEFELSLKDRLNPTGIPSFQDPRGWLDLLKHRIKEYDQEIDLISKRGTPEQEDDIIAAQIAFLREQRMLLIRAADIIGEEDYAMEKRGKRYWVSPLVGNMRNYGKAIFLSATLARPDELDGTAIVIELPSTFPPEQRPVISTRACKLSKGASDLEYRALARSIDNLLLQHNNEKGVVHCVSYELADQIKTLSKYPSLIITHGPGGRDAAIDEFRKAPNGRCLVSPAVSTGVDLPYDLCRWQAIAKVPFANLGDPLARLRAGKHPELANLDTARVLVQMAGRGMRAADDSCTTYILDANFEWFYRSNQAAFPTWFQESVQLKTRQA